MSLKSLAGALALFAYVGLASADANPFFSVVATGKGNYKYLELYNPSDEDISFDQLSIEVIANGKRTKKGKGTHPFSNLQVVESLETETKVASPKVFEAHSHLKICSPQPSNIKPEDCDYYHGKLTQYNGNDSLELKVNGAVTDKFGDDVGNHFDVCGVPRGAENSVVARKETTCSGNSVASSSFGSTEEDCEWFVLPEEAFIEKVFFCGHVPTEEITEETTSDVTEETTSDGAYDYELVQENEIITTDDEVDDDEVDEDNGDQVNEIVYITDEKLINEYENDPKWTEKVIEGLKLMGNGLGEGAKLGVKATKNGVKNAAVGTWNGAKKVGKVVGKAAIKGTTAIVTVGRKARKRVTSSAKAFWIKNKCRVQRGATAFGNRARQARRMGAIVAAATVDGAKKAAVATGNGAKKAVVATGNGAKKAVVATGNGAKKAVVATANGVKKAANGAKKAVVATGNGAKKGLKRAGSAMKKTGGKAMKGLGKGLKRIGKAVGNGAARSFTFVKTGINRALRTRIRFVLLPMSEEDASEIQEELETDIVVPPMTDYYGASTPSNVVEETQFELHQRLYEQAAANH